MYQDIGGIDRHRRFPSNIRDLLRFLKGEKVVIVLKSGQKQAVVVEAVIGNMVVASTCRGIVKFVDINCICEVLAECEDILGNVLAQDKVKKLRENTDIEALEKPAEPYGWQAYNCNKE
ncbi:hypothetical protein RBH29_10475 [Herbivorax sp. ANBcel31]|uniref:hypothetical protein n=1 Tax=Herbivorax sp. ANBcel31 TaxID=3069754 RepID=UPI0027B2548C|nr:hypothetical protein [Herbivorax sp. ANBcel31]MDQ2086850.1 hypothetical protein [Herbivorax sp. ANBcel31]